MALQAIEHHEDERGARRGPEHRDAAAAVHAAEAVLVPQRPSLLHEGAVPRAVPGAIAADRRGLHTGLDGVGGEE